MSLSKIMVVVDPTQAQQPALRRGIESAHLTGARLHLYACINHTIGNGSIDALGATHLRKLEVLALDAESQGLEVTVELDRGHDWPQRALQAAARNSASMLFKNSFTHSDVQREMRHTSDWTLMRLSPCPVLMVKNVRDWTSRRVLAAVNVHSGDRLHQKLNHQIVSVTQQFVDAYGSDGHFVTACSDRNRMPQADDLARSLGAPPEHIHVREGEPYRAIAHTAEELQADLVVIGTVGRSGIKGQVIGNTAERVLDHTLADVLVIN